MTSARADHWEAHGRSLPSEPSERAGSLGPRGDPGIGLGWEGCRGKEDRWTTITADTSTLTTRRGKRRLRERRNGDA